MSDFSNMPWYIDTSKPGGICPPISHSPLPWKPSRGLWIDDVNGDECIRLLAPSHVAAKDMALILRAVNHHDELVEALRNAASALDCIGGHKHIVEQARAILTKLESP